MAQPEIELVALWATELAVTGGTMDGHALRGSQSSYGRLVGELD